LHHPHIGNITSITRRLLAFLFFFLYWCWFYHMALTPQTSGAFSESSNSYETPAWIGAGQRVAEARALAPSSNPLTTQLLPWSFAGAPLPSFSYPGAIPTSFVLVSLATPPTCSLSVTSLCSTPPTPSVDPGRAPPPPPALDDGPRQLIVNFLDLEVTNAELHAAFAAIGPVDAARVIYDKAANRSKGYGFVYYKHSRDAAAATQCMTGHPIRGRRIKASYAVPQRPLAPTDPISCG
jgi:hypothetical protein